ncbi:MAG: low specificity L-threonine aldolase [Rhodobacterales bacterium]|nr:low specificity L-threonine aldolase [Rhodobacterales bacterium]
MNFASDNAQPACPEIRAAVEAAAEGPAMPYGNDPWTERAVAAVRDTFAAPHAEVRLVATGTAANALGLSLLTPPYGAVYCHPEAHVYEDECAAPEFFTGGAKLIPLPDRAGKVAADDLAALLAVPQRGVHHAPHAALTLTQATEYGLVYGVDEVATLAGLCHDHGLAVHMDGARFANAVAALGCAPADITWRAGVDVLSLGASKNGAWACEAVVVFDPTKAPGLEHRRKRAGHLLSKGRFLGAQMAAYLEDGLWLRNAAHANAMAARLSAGLAALPGASLVHPTQANEVFIDLPAPVVDGLEARGFVFYRWHGPGTTLLRLVASHGTLETDVAAFLDAARALA